MLVYLVGGDIDGAGPRCVLTADAPGTQRSSKRLPGAVVARHTATNSSHHLSAFYLQQMFDEEDKRLSVGLSRVKSHVYVLLPRVMFCQTLVVM